MNKIKEVLESKGIDNLRPSDKVLDKLGVKVHTWNMWVKKQKDPDLHQLSLVADFLNCTVLDLLPNKSVSHRSALNHVE
jgi:transcriptional regulator with XRE-family HTH domain